MKRCLYFVLTAALALTACGAQSEAATGPAAFTAETAGTIDCTGSEDVTITAPGSYTLTGSLDGTVIVDVSKSDDVELILQNLTVTSPDGPALWVQKAGTVTVTLPEGSASSLTDGTVYSDQTDEEPNATLFCNANLCIAGAGSLTVTGQFDHAIRCKDTLEVAGGELTLSAAGKGLKAKESLTVSGGCVTVTGSEEGLEANTIVLSGGTVDVTARDDGVNASSPDNWTGDAPSLTVSGGMLLVNAGGDGLDSNGTLTVSGGVVLIAGPTSGGDGALDAESGMTVTGGVVLAAGSRGMAANFGADSTQGSWLADTGAQSAGTSMTLVDETGSVLVHWTPGKDYQSVVVSAPGMVQGGQYTLLAGATVDGTDAFGFAAQGTASGGETAAQTTLETLIQSDLAVAAGGRGGMGGRELPDGAFPDAGADAAPPERNGERPDRMGGKDLQPPELPGGGESA